MDLWMNHTAEDQKMIEVWIHLEIYNLEILES